MKWNWATDSLWAIVSARVMWLYKIMRNPNWYTNSQWAKVRPVKCCLHTLQRTRWEIRTGTQTVSEVRSNHWNVDCHTGGEHRWLGGGECWDGGCTLALYMWSPQDCTTGRSVIEWPPPTPPRTQLLGFAGHIWRSHISKICHLPTIHVLCPCPVCQSVSTLV